MRPIEIACCACAQQPGVACIDIALGSYHPERVEDALYWSGVGNPDGSIHEATDKQFASVVDELL